MQASIEKKSSWLDKSLLGNLSIRWEIVVLVVIFLLAVVSRFYILDLRVMSHDETIHVYHNSLTLYRGQGFQHDPLSHGPLQTLLVALSYFLFGPSDFSARIPAAVFSIITVMFAWNYRRYIGRTGAIVAMILLLISPYMLFYGRYVRNEAFSALFGIVMIWAILRYLETGKDRYAYVLTAATALHFAAKETAFIYQAQALILMALYLIYRLAKNPWPRPEYRTRFIVLISITVLLLSVLGGYMFINREALTLSATEIAAPAVPGQEAEAISAAGASELLLILLGTGLICLLVAGYYLIKGYTWEGVRRERSFGVLVLLGTFVLPQLSAFPVKIMGWNIPINAAQVKAMTMTDYWHFAVFLVPLFIVSVIIGLAWNPRLWLINAAIFYSIFVVLYSTVFTNGAGVFTGLVGSLGYWLEQQGVRRGSQPWYYYLFVQIPIYEYLAALGAILGAIFLFLGLRPVEKNAKEQTSDSDAEDEQEAVPDEKDIQNTALVFLGLWGMFSILAYTVAGEKMPWLTVHITWSLILFGAWGIGILIDTTDWSFIKDRKGWLIVVVLILFITSFGVAISSLLGPTPPFQGKQLDQLQATSTFMVAFIAVVGCGIGLYYLIEGWRLSTFIRVIAVLGFAGLTILTARTAYQASYINYDNANELLVYAHSAGGVKDVMYQVDEISNRVTDGLAIPVAFDGEYPFWWYLRDYTASTYFGENPTRSLRDKSVIIVGEKNFGKIEPVVGNGYNRFDYIRLWWPNQDYFNLTWDKILSAILDPKMRAALFQIWLNRDYSLYGEVTGKDMSLPNWSPSSRMRLYVRKDIISQIWNYGVLPAAEEMQMDPYEGKFEDLSADRVYGGLGTADGQFQRPRGIAIAPDGSLYIADTENNRVQHMTTDGSVLNVWGSFGDVTTGDALGGTFNQPWGIAVGEDGSVFVADTWNHRIQKFSPDGEFIRMWGFFGQAEQPEAFWGPRDVAVDSLGRVFVTDTGNKRVVVFDSDGNYITQFGSTGMSLNEFDEPVGIYVDDNNNVYVVDTWNQRIQVFTELNETLFHADRAWDIAGWYGQSLDNKPYLAVDSRGHVFTTDPEGYRVLEFTNDGEIVRYWGDYGGDVNNFGLAGAVDVDNQGGVWVTDTGNSRIMYFVLPGGEG